MNSSETKDLQADLCNINKDCVICFHPIKKGKESIYKCNHNICIDCISEWSKQKDQFYSNKCPCCRDSKYAITIDTPNSLNISNVQFEVLNTANNTNVQVPYNRRNYRHDTITLTDSNHFKFYCKRISVVLIVLVLITGIILILNYYLNKN